MIVDFPKAEFERSENFIRFLRAKGYRVTESSRKKQGCFTLKGFENFWRIEIFEEKYDEQGLTAWARTLNASIYPTGTKPAEKTETQLKLAI